MMLQLMEGLYGEEVKEMDGIRTGLIDLFKKIAEEDHLSVDMYD